MYAEYRLILLGETGSGKSTFLNYITNYFYGCRDFDIIINDPSKMRLAIPVSHWQENVLPQFHNKNSENNINDCTRSQTSRCIEYSFDNKYQFTDTPGFNHTQSATTSDTENLSYIIDACKMSTSINGVILFLNGSESRLTTTAKNLLEDFKKFFPSKLTQNVIVVLTKCDENSCNFDMSILKDIITIRSHYFMQNTLLRWNKKPMKLRNLEVEWNESIETIAHILNDCTKLSPISTRAFFEIELLSKNVHLNVQKQLSNIYKQLSSYNELNIRFQTIQSSLENIEANKMVEKIHEIEAIPVNSNVPVKIKVKLYDNQTKFQYNHSMKELKSSEREFNKLRENIMNIEREIFTLLADFEASVCVLSAECKGFNFINEFKDTLNELQNMANMNPNVKQYTQCIVNVMEANCRYTYIKPKEVQNEGRNISNNKVENINPIPTKKKKCTCCTIF